jgi:mono/diheme cytochrome c family protein
MCSIFLSRFQGMAKDVRVAQPGRSPHKMLKRAGVLVTAMVFLLLAGKVFAAEPSGAQEYKDNCARCHGTDATGKGQDADNKPGYHPADLTHISKDHGGTFPHQEIYDVIDGGKRLPAHFNFNSPMPLWGLSFQLKGKEYSEESEAAVKRKINALLDYLESIQEK